jgi:hypothetical protein
MGVEYPGRSHPTPNPAIAMTQRSTSNGDMLKQLRSHARKLRGMAAKLGRERRQMLLEIVEDFERLIDEIVVVLPSKAAGTRAKRDAKIRKPNA